MTNRSPVISNFESSSTVVYACGTENGLCPPKTRSTVTLKVTATDPEGDTLSYSYSTSGGEIFGEGNVVSWRLGNQPFGKYSVTVKVMDSKGAEGLSSINVSVGRCDCMIPDPPCPLVSVSASSDSTFRGELLNFHVTVMNDSYFLSRPDYVWSVTNGEIIKGQHTPWVKVKVTGVEPPDRLVAKVEVVGFDAACQTSASENVVIKQ